MAPKIHQFRTSDSDTSTSSSEFNFDGRWCYVYLASVVADYLPASTTSQLAS